MKISLTYVTEHGEVDTITGATTLSTEQLARKLFRLAHPLPPRPKPQRVAVTFVGTPQLQDHTISPVTAGFDYHASIERYQERRSREATATAPDEPSLTPILDAISADQRKQRAFYWGHTPSPDEQTES